MSAFAGRDLFGSGPHAFAVHGLAQRQVAHESPGPGGVRLMVQGRRGRVIEQMGTLLADSVASLQAQLEAIEASINGQATALIDDLGRRWEDVMMLEFDPRPARRVGVRLAVEYRARYVQLGEFG